MKDSIAQLQALLLTARSAIPKKRLAVLLSCKEQALDALLEQARASYKACGITIVDDGAQVRLATDPSLSSFLEQKDTEERAVPLSRASQETLAVIAYAGPVAKRSLDFVRGVNTSYTLRRLLVRGLIRRAPGRVFALSAELLTHLGLSSVKELPDYEHIRAHLLETLQSTQGKDQEETA